MNKIYAQRHGIPISDTKQDRATRATEKMIERERQSRERTAHIIDYYTDLQQMGVKI